MSSRYYSLQKPPQPRRMQQYSRWLVTPKSSSFLLVSVESSQFIPGPISDQIVGCSECGIPTLASALFQLLPSIASNFVPLSKPDFTASHILPGSTEVAAPATIIARSMIRTSPRKEAWPSVSLSSMPRKACAAYEVDWAR